MELNKFYEIVTPTGITNTFEETIIKTQDNCTLSPPMDRPHKRRHAIPDSRVNTDITLEILDQRVRNLELKIDNVKKKVDIQRAKDEIVTKIEERMSYNRQLFHAVTTKFH